MARFKYKAVSADGQLQSGEIEAPSRAVAISRLQTAGHLPLSAEEVVAQRSIFHRLRPGPIRRHGVKHRDVITLTRELATMLQAGMPLDSALKTLRNTTSSDAVKSLITSIDEKIHDGASLSDAMSTHSGIFDQLYLNMIRAGETGGSLQTVIDRMADYLEQMDELRSSAINALIYPAILLAITAVSLIVLMTFVVPQFIPLFEDVGEALPWVTRVVFGLAGLFQQYWWLLIGFIVAALWFGERQLATPQNRIRFDRWLLGLPVAGTLLTQLDVARFARTLGTLLRNGVPVITAVMLARDVLNNRIIADIVNETVENLEQGRGLSSPLRESGRFPPLAVQLIEIGEESGQLESMLMKVADIYDREVRTSIKRMLTLLEPAIILILGGIIAVIILSILMALLGLNELIG